MIRKIFKWIFKEELEHLQKVMLSAKKQEEQLKERVNKVDTLLGAIDISVDVNYHAPSWAVISIQGQQSDYIKFVNLGSRDIREIADFLRNYDRGKVDCSPSDSRYLRFKHL